MFYFFKCKHPADSLNIKDVKPTVKQVDDNFNHVTFHMTCLKCGADVDVTCASFVGGVDAFFARRFPVSVNP